MQVYYAYLPYVPHVVALLASGLRPALRYLVAQRAVCILSVRIEQGIEEQPSSVEDGILRLCELAREVLAALPLDTEGSEPDPVDGYAALVEKVVSLSEKHPRVMHYLTKEYQHLGDRFESHLRHTEGAFSEDLAYHATWRAMYKFLSFAESQCRKGNRQVSEDPDAYHRFLYGKCWRSALVEELRGRRVEGRIVSVHAPFHDQEDDSFEDRLCRDRRARATGHTAPIDLEGFAGSAEDPGEEVAWTEVEIQQFAAWIERLLRFFRVAGSHREHAFSLWHVLLQFPECLSEQGFSKKLNEFLHNQHRNAWCDEVTRRTGWGQTAKSPVARNKAVSRIRDALRRAWEISAGERSELLRTIEA